MKEKFETKLDGWKMHLMKNGIQIYLIYYMRGDGVRTRGWGLYDCTHQQPEVFERRKKKVKRIRVLFLCGLKRGVGRHSNATPATFSPSMLLLHVYRRSFYPLSFVTLANPFVNNRLPYMYSAPVSLLVCSIKLFAAAPIPFGWVVLSIKQSTQNNNNKKKCRHKYQRTSTLRW